MHEPVNITPNQKYWAMVNASRKQLGPLVGNPAQEYRLVSFDPGETTGVCIWNPLWKHLALYQLPTPTIEAGIDIIQEHVPESEFPTIWVCEDYKVYGWKADDHKWAGLHTPQLIGAIRCLAHQRKIQMHFAMAQEAKQWVTDEKLRLWGLYHAGMKHARDAQRHMVTYHFFGKPVQP